MTTRKKCSFCQEEGGGHQGWCPAISFRPTGFYTLAGVMSVGAVIGALTVYPRLLWWV